ncbi:Zn-dependent protease (includes SpoIVFB) [Amycolatopsis marina]|uniref:Zinc metalloprotease n=1 Tax=Amycolatopsis marina TaxID=490629 RepID=A0A1I0Z442_9PSEU|nr:site-2 protease family protein [Amycolatopsis marina]SFB19360.1 Zn-dependent protease (includes SpoIVFB) [Amycolatopsis marina]
MTETVRLGRILGVRVGLHWSVLGIVLLLVLGLSTTQLPDVLPGYPAWAYVLTAVAIALLFAISLLAHEVSHAVVARRNGIEVDGITLWLLGGVARLRSEPRTPGADLRVAVIGPLTSIGCGALFGLAAFLVSIGDLHPLLRVLFLYLAGVNVLLAVFNMIPAAPLDGGRVLRAAVWAWRGDRLMAAVWSARAGRWFGFLLITLGLVRLLLGYGLGLWWILIGLFVVHVASAEEQRARLGTALSGMRVDDVMTPEPDTAHGDRNVSDFLRDVALVRRHSAFPLLDDSGRLQGMVTLNRLRGVAPGERERTPLRAVACPPAEIVLAEPGEPLTALLPRLGSCADGRALVYDRGTLVGIVTPSDVSRAVALSGLGVTWHEGADVTNETGNGYRTRH